MKFDYIIAGGGTCGLLLANRLSEDANVTVAVIEVGGDVRDNPNVTNPDNFFASWNSPIDWAYPTTPQSSGNNRTLTLHAGKAIGGSSTINGMVYIRADAAEIDAWETLGSEGWNWEALLPYYKKVEKFITPTEAQAIAGASYDPAYNGEDGDLHVGFRYSLPNGSFYPITRETWANLGYSDIPDVNAGNTRGFDVYPMTIDRDTDLRWDAARAYYYPVEGRTNLHIIQGTAVKLVWDNEDDDTGKVASGITYIDVNNETITLSVGKEVILSAGALRSPLILEMSGIGNTKILSDLGIETVIDLEGVGEHLQDQANTALYFTGTLNTTGNGTYVTFGTAEDIFGANKSVLAASTNASLSDYATAVAKASNNGLNTTALEQIFRVQHDLVFSKNVTIAEITTTYYKSYGYYFTDYWLLFPFSRGSVHLNATDRTGNPVLDPRYFLIDFDLQQEVAMGRQAHDFWHTSPMGEYITASVVGDPSSDEELAEYILNSFNPNFHSVGTAAMMPRELGGVVDKELRVYGTSNVRVVDASVLPLQVSGHPTATLYAVAERISDIIRGINIPKYMAT